MDNCKTKDLLAALGFVALWLALAFAARAFFSGSRFTGLITVYLAWIIMFWFMFGYRSKRLKIVIVLASPLLVPAFLGWWGIEHYFLQEWRFHRVMRRAGRVMGPAELRGQARRGGTILLDNAAFNHCRQRVWWTSDDVLARAPEPPPAGYRDDDAMDHSSRSDTYVWPAFDRWVWERYLAPEGGTAYLVCSSLKGRSLASVGRKYPGYQVVRTFSGGLELAEFFAEAMESEADGDEEDVG